MFGKISIREIVNIEGKRQVLNQLPIFTLSGSHKVYKEVHEGLEARLFFRFLFNLFFCHFGLSPTTRHRGRKTPDYEIHPLSLIFTH